MDIIERKIQDLRTVLSQCNFSPQSKEEQLFHGVLDVLSDMSMYLESFVDAFDCGEALEDEEAYYAYTYICTGCGSEFEVPEDDIERKESVTCPKCGLEILLGVLNPDDLKF